MMLVQSLVFWKENGMVIERVKSMELWTVNVLVQSMESLLMA